MKLEQNMCDKSNYRFLMYFSYFLTFESLGISNNEFTMGVINTLWYKIYISRTWGYIYKSPIYIYWTLGYTSMASRNNFGTLGTHDLSWENFWEHGDLLCDHEGTHLAPWRTLLGLWGTRLRCCGIFLEPLATILEPRRTLLATWGPKTWLCGNYDGKLFFIGGMSHEPRHRLVHPSCQVLILWHQNRVYRAILQYNPMMRDVLRMLPGRPRRMSLRMKYVVMFNLLTSDIVHNFKL